MNKLFLFVLFLLSQFVFAGNSVGYLGLNGPVKRYAFHSQVYYFDEAGYLTHADRCRTVDIRMSWKECYKHVLDESGNLIKTYIAKTAPPFVEEAMSDSIVYNDIDPFIDDFYKNKIGRRRKKMSLSNGGTAIYYYKKGFLNCIEYENKYESKEYQYIVKYHCKSKSDSLEKVEIIFKYLTKSLVADVDENNKMRIRKYYEKEDDTIRDEQYTYYEDGRVKQKTMYRKNYNIAWEISNIDCVITYIYDEWKNMIKEEWYYKDTGETSFVDYEIEYYE